MSPLTSPLASQLASPIACYEISLEFQEAQLGRVLQLPEDQGCETGYPHSSLMEFFTEERIRALVSCSCKRCVGRCEPDVDSLVPKVRDTGNSYVGVLSFLLLYSKWYFIFRFIEKGFSDQKLSTLDVDGHPVIHEEDFIQMLALSPKAGDKSTEYVHFFSFFLPILRYQDRSIAEPRRIHRLQVLPFNITTRIGEGGYSTVYATQILPGYHDFDGAKVCAPRITTITTRRLRNNRMVESL
jgi:hypothetical protein